MNARRQYEQLANEIKRNYTFEVSPPLQMTKNAGGVYLHYSGTVAATGDFLHPPFRLLARVWRVNQFSSTYNFREVSYNPATQEYMDVIDGWGTLSQSDDWPSGKRLTQSFVEPHSSKIPSGSIVELYLERDWITKVSGALYNADSAFYPTFSYLLIVGSHGSISPHVPKAPNYLRYNFIDPLEEIEDFKSFVAQESVSFTEYTDNDTPLAENYRSTTEGITFPSSMSLDIQELGSGSSSWSLTAYRYEWGDGDSPSQPSETTDYFYTNYEINGSDKFYDNQSSPYFFMLWKDLYARGWTLQVGDFAFDNNITVEGAPNEGMTNSLTIEFKDTQIVALVTLGHTITFTE